MDLAGSVDARPSCQQVLHHLEVERLGPKNPVDGVHGDVNIGSSDQGHYPVLPHLRLVHVAAGHVDDLDRRQPDRSCGTLDEATGGLTLTVEPLAIFPSLQAGTDAMDGQQSQVRHGCPPVVVSQGGAPGCNVYSEEPRGEPPYGSRKPHPWGMAQTGVPFGEIAAARDFLKIDAPIGRPEPQHPKREIVGFATTRSEVSGRRLWGWARDAFGTADAFFDRCFVANYCPLVWMEDSGRNRVPEKLPKAERAEVNAICNTALRQLTEALQPEWVVGVGKFAEDRAREALDGLQIHIGRILHPSPASPKANRGWERQATEEITALGIDWPAA